MMDSRSDEVGLRCGRDRARSGEIGRDRDLLEQRLQGRHHVPPHVQPLPTSPPLVLLALALALARLAPSTLLGQSGGRAQARARQRGARGVSVVADDDLGLGGAGDVGDAAEGRAAAPRSQKQRLR